jgi:hypothetical protein
MFTLFFYRDYFLWKLLIKKKAQTSKNIKNNLHKKKKLCLMLELANRSYHTHTKVCVV